MGHSLLAAIWAVAVSACAGVGGAYLVHAFRIRGGILNGIESDHVGLGVMLLLLAWFAFRFGKDRFLP
jgi:hypothetical protein